GTAPLKRSPPARRPARAGSSPSRSRGRRARSYASGSGAEDDLPEQLAVLHQPEPLACLFEGDDGVYRRVDPGGRAEAREPVQLVARSERRADDPKLRHEDPVQA